MPPLPDELKTEIVVLRPGTELGTTYGNRLYPQDQTLISRGGRNVRAYQIYEELGRDPHTYAVLQKRYSAVIGREWEVLPASENRRDRSAADRVKVCLRSLGGAIQSEIATIAIGGGFDQVCLNLLQATLYGFAIAEIIWQQDGKEIYPAEILKRDIRNFGFEKNRERGYYLRLISEKNDWNPLPARKFLVHRFDSGGLQPDPYGLGLGARLFFPNFFKRSNIKYWLAFVDKYAMPTAVGKYPAGASAAEKQKLLEMLQAIAQESHLVIPDHVAVEFLEAQRSASVTCYQELAEFCNNEISKTVLGETGTTDQQTGGGSRARDQIGNEVRIEIAKADADLLSDPINQLARWITYFNDSEAAPPTIWRKFPELDAKFDRSAEASVISTLANAGYKPTQTWVAAQFEIELQPEEAVANPDTPPDVTGILEPPALAPDFAEADPDAIDRLTKRSPPAITPTLNDWLAIVQDLLNQAESLETVRDRVFELFGELSVKTFATQLAIAIAIAELTGRYEVIQENDAPPQL